MAIFLAGLLTTAALLPGLSASRAPVDAMRGEVRRLVRFNRFGTTPALLIVWALGIAMSVDAGLYASGWLKAKVALVLAVSAWHGVQMRTLRRIGAGRGAPRTGYRALALLVLALVTIIGLVVVKPF